jgi:hypothetical protein
MPRTTPVTIKVTDLPAAQTAITEAIAAERRRLLVLVQATCACRQCKGDVAAVLAAGKPGDKDEVKATAEKVLAAWLARVQGGTED